MLKFVIIVALATLSLATPENSVEEFIKTNNLFASKLYKETLATTKADNFVVSPLATEFVLAFVKAHFEENAETAQEIGNVIGLSEEAENAIKTIKSCPTLKNNVRMFSSIFSGRHVKDELVNSANDYGLKIENLDTEANKVAEKINELLKTETKDKTIDLEVDKDSVNPDKAVLVSAIFPRAYWAHRFSHGNTKNMNFHKSDQQISTEFIYGESNTFKYIECSHLKARFVEIPFENGEFNASLTIIMPQDGQTFDSLENNIALALKPHNVKPEQLNVAIPKFKVETEIDLLKTLKHLGMEKELGLVGLAKQKVVFNLNEQGVNAPVDDIAIPTSDVSDSGIKFHVDRPFIFYVKVNKVIVVVGRVTAPVV